MDEETVLKKMMNYAYTLKDPKMEAEFLESQVYVMLTYADSCSRVLMYAGVC